MKVAVIGCGSMGTKHINNLLELGHEVAICDSNIFRLKESAQKFQIQKTCENFRDLPDLFNPDAAIIATDTSFHAKIACFFAQKGIAYFSEIPISDALGDLRALTTATIENNVVSMVGMVWRFHPAIQKIKQLVQDGEIGKVNTISSYGGEYLHDWHPKEPYKKEYSALLAKGGGVIVTNISGIDYLRFLCGDVENAFAVYDSISHIDIEAEDFFMGVLQFKNGVFAQIYSDFFQRPVEHRLDIVGDNGKIHWDHHKKVVRHFSFSDGPSGEWNEYPYELNDFLTLYKEEMKHFLSCVKEKKETIVPVYDNVKTVLVGAALKQSFVERRMVNVSNLKWSYELRNAADILAV